MGTEEYGDPAGAVWVDDLDGYLLLDQSIIIDWLHAFDFTGPNSVAGCYYQSDTSTGDLSDCYGVTGTRTVALTKELMGISESWGDMELRESMENRSLVSGKHTVGSRLVETLEFLRRAIR